MTESEKQAMAHAMRSALPKMPPQISAEELEQFPCTIQEQTLELPGTVPVHIFVTAAQNRQPQCPLMVNYHGGGFIAPRTARDELFCRRIAHTFSCIVVDVDYALSPDYSFPTAIEQGRAIAVWAKENAETLGCDPERLILLGQSAGANIVANVCMQEAETPLVHPLCAVMGYPPLDLVTDPADKPRKDRDLPPERAQKYNALYCTPEQAHDPHASPLLATPAQLAAFPPTLLITADEDRLADEGDLFAMKLAQAGVVVTAKRFQGCVHGFFVNRMDDWEAAIALIHRYLAVTLEGA